MLELYDRLAENDLIVEDKIKLNEFSDVEKSIFETFFGDCAGNSVSYACMSGSHTFMWGDPPREYTRTAEELGYLGFFDTWLQLGILSN